MDLTLDLKMSGAATVACLFVLLAALPLQAHECACTLDYSPVCGCNGVTYGNACAAACERVRVARKGECPAKGGACPSTLEPVCGTNGRSYRNKCLAKCAGTTYKAGKCKVCRCTKEYVPVCGANGKTYANKCAAECDLVAYKRGKCPDLCPGGKPKVKCNGSLCAATTCLKGSVCEEVSTCKACTPTCKPACLAKEAVCSVSSPNLCCKGLTCKPPTSCPPNAKCGSTCR